MKNTSHRLKSVSGWIAILCIFIGPLGTVYTMIKAFRSASETSRSPLPDELARDINYSLSTTVALMPVAIIAGLIWFACRLRISHTARGSKTK